MRDRSQSDIFSSSRSVRRDSLLRHVLATKPRQQLHISIAGDFELEHLCALNELANGALFGKISDEKNHLLGGSWIMDLTRQ